jgi:hypothetical protein
MEGGSIMDFTFPSLQSSILAPSALGGIGAGNVTPGGLTASPADAAPADGFSALLSSLVTTDSNLPVAPLAPGVPQSPLASAAPQSLAFTFAGAMALTSAAPLLPVPLQPAAIASVEAPAGEVDASDADQLTTDLDASGGGRQERAGGAASGDVTCASGNVTVAPAVALVTLPAQTVVTAERPPASESGETAGPGSDAEPVATDTSASAAKPAASAAKPASGETAVARAPTGAPRMGRPAGRGSVAAPRNGPVVRNASTRSNPVLAESSSNQPATPPISAGSVATDDRPATRTSVDTSRGTAAPLPNTNVGQDGQALPASLNSMPSTPETRLPAAAPAVVDTATASAVATPAPSSVKAAPVASAAKSVRGAEPRPAARRKEAGESERAAVTSVAPVANVSFEAAAVTANAAMPTAPVATVSADSPADSSETPVNTAARQTRQTGVPLDQRSERAPGRAVNESPAFSAFPSVSPEIRKAAPLAQPAPESRWPVATTDVMPAEPSVISQGEEGSPMNSALDVTSLISDMSRGAASANVSEPSLAPQASDVAVAANPSEPAIAPTITPNQDTPNPAVTAGALKASDQAAAASLQNFAAASVPAARASSGGRALSGVALEKIAATPEFSASIKNVVNSVSGKSAVVARNEQVASSSAKPGISSAELDVPMARFNVEPLAPSAAAPAAPVNETVPASTPPAAESSNVAAAHRAVETVVDLSERFAARDRHSVSLQFTVGDTDLRVHVALRAGAVHTTFQTDSAELRDALASEWQNVVSSTAAERTHRHAAPVFTSTESSMSGGGGDGASRGRHSQTPEAQPSFGRFGASRHQPAPGGTAAPVEVPAASNSSQHLHIFA